MRNTNKIPLFTVTMNIPGWLDHLQPVINSGYIGQGPKVELFESQLKHVLHTKTTPVTVNSCTSAIDLALELLGVKEGDEIITTPQTCFASNVHIMHRKAIIRWADIDPITGLINPQSVNKLINRNTKAIIAVNWAGKACDYRTLKSFGIPVIEDAAHSWEGYLHDSKIEKIERGDYTCYSFQAIKFLTCGDGGALVCPPEKEQEARILRWYGLDRTKGQSFRCTQDIERVGFKYHMNDISAAIGSSNISTAQRAVMAHRYNAYEYIKNIDNPLFILPEKDEYCSYWLFSMHVKDGLKQKFMDYLKDNNIESSPVHFRNDMYTCTKAYREDQLPGVDSFTDTQVCIPVGVHVDTNLRKYIIQTLNNFKGL